MGDRTLCLSLALDLAILIDYPKSKSCPLLDPRVRARIHARNKRDGIEG
jgi:hypothetical protein